MKQYLKIFPLLILVSVLTFGVKLAEVVSGFSTLEGGAAFAEEKAKDVSAKDAEDVEAVEEKKGGPVEKVKKEESEEPASKTMSKAEEEIIWRDATDSDINTNTVKMEMFEDLAERRKALDARERNLMTREALLKAAEQELERKYQELSSIREEIKTLLKEQSDEEQARIESLVKIYEGMKAKEAARIFNTLDLDILVDVMTQMSERKIAPVLAEMDPERARTITIMMAEQKKLPKLPLNN